jgi:hypothetical protein
VGVNWKALYAKTKEQYDQLRTVLEEDYRIAYRMTLSPLISVAQPANDMVLKMRAVLDNWEELEREVDCELMDQQDAPNPSLLGHIVAGVVITNDLYLVNARFVPEWLGDDFDDEVRSQKTGRLYRVHRNTSQPLDGEWKSKYRIKVEEWLASQQEE